jgi:hypothetical protein
MLLAVAMLAGAAHAQPVPGSGGHAPGAKPSIEPANFQAPISGTARQPITGGPLAPAERVYYEGPESDPILGNLNVTCGAGGCNHCGRFGGPSAGPFGNGCLGGMYVRGEYLLWNMRGMDLPALITTSPNDTDEADAGVLGLGSTEILFGGNSVNSDVQSGGRLTIGWWFDPCRRLGIEGDYFALGDADEGFRASSDGTPIIAQPFYDIVNGEENAVFIAFPDQIRGQVEAEAQTSFHGAGLRAIYNLCCGDGCGTSCITCQPVTTGYRFDAIVGYRYLRLDDRVGIVEDSTSLLSSAPGSFFISDLFESGNDFHGIDFGTSLSWCKGCWSLDLLSKIALGNTRSNVHIDGSTVLTENGTAEAFDGGIFAQRTNIGDYEADEFAVVPELGVTVGYQINPCWRATLGYSFIYWSRVARAGDQIDRDLNPDLFPPEQTTVTTHLRPDFDFHYTDFWAQGMTLGLEGSW